MKTGPATRMLKFLERIRYLTKDKQAHISVTKIARDEKAPYYVSVRNILVTENILSATKNKSGLHWNYRWISPIVPDIAFAEIMISKCADYSRIHTTKPPKNIDSESKSTDNPNHIAVSGKYLIPFMANDLRYVNTIEEGIELISSVIVAAGDYNIYKLVAKVQKISKIKINNI